MHQFDGGGVRVKAERDVDAAHRGQDVGEDAVPARIARHVVEQHRPVADAALVDVDDAADLLLALGARDVLQLAGGAQLRDPSAQVLPVACRLLLRRPSLDGGVHARAPYGHRTCLAEK